MASQNMKPLVEDTYLTPMKISRATNQLDSVREFYNSDIGVELLHETTFAEDGSQLLAFIYDQDKIFIGPYVDAIYDFETGPI